jgi:hypothetical protein
MAYKNPIVLGFLILFILQVIGLLNTTNIDLGVTEVSQRLAFAVLPPIIIGENIDNTEKRKILIFFKNTVLSILVLTLLYHFVFFQKGITSFVFFGFKKISVSPFYYSLFIFLAILSSLKYTGKYKIVEISILLLFLFLLGNRTAFIFILIFLFLYKLSLNIKQKIGLSILGLLVMIFVFSTSNPLVNKFKVLYKTTDFDIETIQTKNSITVTRNTIEHRILIWKEALNIIKNNFWFGVGTGDYQKELNKQYKNINFKAALLNHFNTHNQYIEEYIKLGIIGGSFFLLFTFFLIKNNLSNDFLLPIVLLIILISFFESYWSRHHGIVFVAFVIPLLSKNKK